jgi:RNA polymerase-binding transcription factor DksA
MSGDSDAAMVDRQLHALLAAERAATADRIAMLSQDLEAIVEAGSLVATDDEHDPEGSTIAFERSQTSAFLAGARRHLADLDSALERIDAGDYGRCERCGKPIAAERLLARPTARTCIDCAV